MINARVDNWQAIGWLCERQYYSRWAKPEVQISLNNSFNHTVNALSITISPEEIREVEAQAAPDREKVRQMFESYRPGALGGGNTERDRDAAIAESVREKFSDYRAGG